MAYCMSKAAIDHFTKTLATGKIQVQHFYYKTETDIFNKDNNR